MKEHKTNSTLKQIETMIWEAMAREETLGTDEILVLLERNSGKKMDPRWEKRYIQEIKKIRHRLSQKKHFFRKRAEELAVELDVDNPDWVYRWIMSGWIQLNEIAKVRNLIKIIQERDIASAFRGGYKIPVDGSTSVDKFVPGIMPDNNPE